jgi:hypothetical protein
MQVKFNPLLAKQKQLTKFRSTYIKQNIAKFGKTTTISAEKTIASRFAQPGTAKPRSSMLLVGEAPDGFGKQILWDAKDPSLAVIAFLNAGDDLGVMISGVKATDTIEFVSATGNASFAEEIKNEGVPAFIGVVAVGANLVTSAFGQPELAPIITAADDFAKKQFQEEKVKTKRRDPFGVDPGTGHKARQEGGVIVSMPEAGQIFHSGDSDHESLWIKEPGTRDSIHHPDHVRNAFFLQGRPFDERKATADGDIIISPWDFKFEDNFGFYRLHILLKRGSGKPRVID